MTGRQGPGARGRKTGDENMTMAPVEQSSNVAAVGYDAESQVLRVRFHSGAEYEYDGVPAEHHQALLASPSKGKHLARNIRGQYATRKL
jgi:hypothetical protein